MLFMKPNLEEMNKYIYGDEWSKLWQKYFAHRPTTDETVKFLSNLAPNGKALELGVGSGRIALPLSESGMCVTGLDSSTAMLSYLQKNDKKSAVQVVVGNAENFELNDKDFDLVYFVSWGLHALLNEEKVRGCFESVSRHLNSGGFFVIECMHYEGYKFSDGALQIAGMDTGLVVLSGEIRNSDAQLLLNTYVFLRDNEAPRVHTSASHYWTTEQLDAIAIEAEFDFIQEYGSWDKSLLTNATPNMIRLYQRK